MPTEKITITERGIQMKVPAILNPEDTLTLNILNSDVIKVSNVDKFVKGHLSHGMCMYTFFGNFTVFL